ncbi:MAG: hypothetical protein ACI9YG_000278 [Candidatus Azotimanducaceae bacterium]|jgi:hypothetical protein
MRYMKDLIFTDSQIMTTLKQGQAVAPLAHLCREHGIGIVAF